MPGTEGGSSTKTKASLSLPICWRRSAKMPSLVSPALIRSSNGCEAHEDDARVGSIGEGCAVEADERDGGCHAGARQHDVGGIADDSVRAVESRARRKLECGDEVGAIELRDEAGRRVTPADRR